MAYLYSVENHTSHLQNITIKLGVSTQKSMIFTIRMIFTFRMSLNKVHFDQIVCKQHVKVKVTYTTDIFKQSTFRSIDRYCTMQGD